MTCREIQESLREQQAELKRLCVRRLALFGSAAREEATGNSDLDFLVEFTGPATFNCYMDLKFLLEDLFGRRVDLVTRQALRAELRPTVEKEAINVA